jgi:hypothetical protein
VVLKRVIMYWAAAKTQSGTIGIHFYFILALYLKLGTLGLESKGIGRIRNREHGIRHDKKPSTNSF